MQRPTTKKVGLRS